MTTSKYKYIYSSVIWRLYVVIELLENDVEVFGGYTFVELIFVTSIHVWRMVIRGGIPAGMYF